MKFWLRWVADSVAVFLVLYLVDSLLGQRFHLDATWAGVLAAVLLGFINSFVRPLHRARDKTHRAVLTAVLTVLVNAFVLQIFVWVGADVSTQGFVWVVLAAAFVALICGLINWQIGFNQKDRPSPTIREKTGTGDAGTKRKAARG